MDFQQFFFFFGKFLVLGKLAKMFRKFSCSLKWFPEYFSDIFIKFRGNFQKLLKKLQRKFKSE